MNASFLNKIPEFSNQNFTYASYICGSLFTASSVFFIYEMFTYSDFGISIQWNIFKSAWFSPLFIVGIILAIVYWGRFGHWSSQTYNVYKDQNGKKYVEKDNDITENIFTHFMLPILGHFVIEPIIYACLIFYPLMCVFALLGFILPYVIAIFLIVIAIAMFLSSRYAIQIRYRSLILILITLLLGGGLTWASISMEQSKNPQAQYIEEQNDDMFEDSTTNDSTSTDDDMFEN